MRAGLAADAAEAVLAAGATGVPIKIAAALAPASGIGMAAFLSLGFAQRLARFAAVALLAAGAARVLPDRWTRGMRLALWTAFWILFYAVYWTILV
jgi:hypothetical protein